MLKTAKDFRKAIDENIKKEYDGCYDRVMKFLNNFIHQGSTKHYMLYNDTITEEAKNKLKDIGFDVKFKGTGPNHPGYYKISW